MTGISKQLLQGHMFIDYYRKKKWYSEEMSNWCVTSGHALIKLLLNDISASLFHLPPCQHDCHAALPQSMSFV